MSPAAQSPQARAGTPIFRRLLLAFAAVTLVPVLALSLWVYRVAWENAREEIHEKHGLLARNLASPLYEYLDKHRAMLRLAADRVADAYPRWKGEELAHLLEDLLESYADLDMLAALEESAGTTRLLGAVRRENGGFTLLARLPPGGLPRELFVHPRDGSPLPLSSSGVRRSPYTGRPAVFLSAAHPVDATRRVRLLAELNVDAVERLRRTVRFGRKGHSAIVDQFGRVVAHPNPQWMAEMKDIADWPIVEKMLAGETGVTTFYSPFIGEDMVAGFASVPQFGWGIMVPQPLSEVKEKVWRYMGQHLLWLAGGLVATFVLAFYLALWITRPVNRLAAASLALDPDLTSPSPSLSPVSRRAPREVNQLSQALNQLLKRLAERQHQINTIVDHAPLLFLIADAEGRVRFAAGRLLSLWRHAGDLKDASLQSLFAGRLELDELLQRLRGGESRWLTLRSGDDTVLDLWFCPTLDEAGRVEQIILVGSDVSDSYLASRTAQLLEDNRRLLQRALSAEEEQRQRLARELHDQLGQDLAATRNYAAAIAQTVERELAEVPQALRPTVAALGDYAKRIADIAAHVQGNVRAMLERLRPETLDELGLVEAIREMLEAQKAQVAEVEFNVKPEVEAHLTDAALKTALYRIAQESLTNVAKHARAHHVEVSLCLEGKPPARVRLTVWDDGVGFTPARVRGGLGLAGMRERMAALGGKLDIESEPGQGCTVTAVAPLRPTAAPA